MASGREPELRPPSSRADHGAQVISRRMKWRALAGMRAMSFTVTGTRPPAAAPVVTVALPVQFVVGDLVAMVLQFGAVRSVLTWMA